MTVARLKLVCRDCGRVVSDGDVEYLTLCPRCARKALKAQYEPYLGPERRTANRLGPWSVRSDRRKSR